jgi:hypothetical protein
LRIEQSGLWNVKLSRQTMPVCRFVLRFVEGLKFDAVFEITQVWKTEKILKNVSVNNQWHISAAMSVARICRARQNFKLRSTSAPFVQPTLYSLVTCPKACPRFIMSSHLTQHSTPRRCRRLIPSVLLSGSKLLFFHFSQGAAVR